MRFYRPVRPLLSIVIVAAGLFLAACGTAPKAPVVATQDAASAPKGKPAPILPKAGSGRGGYYKDDGPGDNPPDGLELTLDAEPKVEPYSLTGNKPYVVFGKTYTPQIEEKPFSQRGTGSWYGKKFQGQRTSSGEPYDMYKMTAAHPTLPIPSYARITNTKNGKQVIVKINDRGPFHTNRIVDLSYTAALKLDYLGHGSTELLLERLLPEDIEKMAENKSASKVAVKTAGSSGESFANRATTNVAIAKSSTRLASGSAVGSANKSASKRAVEPAVESAGGAVGEPVRGTVAEPISSTFAVASVPVITAVALPDSAPQTTSASVQTASVAPASLSSVPAGSNSFYLQFGAYGLRSNAEAIYKHLTTALVDKFQGQLPPVEIVQQGTLYRLFSGPFASRAEAMSALQLTLTSGIARALIVQR